MRCHLAKCACGVVTVKSPKQECERGAELQLATGGLQLASNFGHYRELHWQRYNRDTTGRQLQALQRAPLAALQPRHNWRSNFRHYSGPHWQRYDRRHNCGVRNSLLRSNFRHYRGIHWQRYNRRHNCGFRNSLLLWQSLLAPSKLSYPACSSDVL